MAVTDARLTHAEKTLLAGMIGKSLDELVHDNYVINPSSYMSVWLVVDGSVYELHRETEVINRFGDKDDVAVTRLRQSRRESMRTHIVGRKLVTDMIGRLIEDIKVVEDTQTITKDVDVGGTFIFTSAVIFELGGTEIVLEPDTWFSEDIFIERGPGASKRLPDAIEDVAKPVRTYTTVTREIVSLKCWGEGRG